MKSSCVYLFLIATLWQPALTTGGKRFLKDAISPSLRPESDKAFNDDYPKDHQPVAKRAFDYPYPIVQDSGDYDKDYIKDENADGGEWKAQFNFDRLRTSIGKQKAKMKDSAKSAEEAQNDLNEAKKRMAAAKGESEQAEEEAKVATEAADKADKKVKGLIGDAAATSDASSSTNDKQGATGTSGNSTVVGGKVGEGAKEVERRVEGLKDCQEQLAQARAALEKAVEDKKKREEEAKAKAAQAQRDADEKAKKTDQKLEEDKKKKINEKENKLEEAKQEAIAADVDEDEVAKAKAAAVQAQAKVKELEDRVHHEEAEVARAEKEYNSQTHDVDNTENEISQAETRLRKFRKADAGGGVYSTVKSGADSAALSSSLAVLLCVWSLR